MGHATEAAACRRATTCRGSSSATTTPSTASLGGYWHHTCGRDTACADIKPLSDHCTCINFVGDLFTLSFGKCMSGAVNNPRAWLSCEPASKMTHAMLHPENRLTFQSAGGEVCWSQAMTCCRMIVNPDPTSDGS